MLRVASLTIGAGAQLDLANNVLVLDYSSSGSSPLAALTSLVTSVNFGAIVTTLAREGASVILNGRSEASVSAGLAEVRAAVPNAKVEGFTMTQ